MENYSILLIIISFMVMAILLVTTWIKLVDKDRKISALREALTDGNARGRKMDEEITELMTSTREWRKRAIALQEEKLENWKTL